MQIPGSSPQLRHFGLLGALLFAACAGDPPRTATSSEALVSAVDGLYFYPPLVPSTPVFSGTFDASLLSGLTMTLEGIDAGGAVQSTVTFGNTTTPALTLNVAAQLYLINIPAAAHFTNPGLTYRLYVHYLGHELGFADVPVAIFSFIATNPTFTFGVRFRMETRAAPVLTSISPASAPAGSAVEITAAGSFVADSVVRFNGTELATTHVSASQLTAVVPAELATLGTHTVDVHTPAPGGGTSAQLSFEALSLAPVLAAITPASAVAGDAGFSLSVSGASFAADAIVSFGGAPLATTFVSASELLADVPAAAIAIAGDFEVRVTNPGAGDSDALTFQVANPVPAAIAVTPHAAFAGSSDRAITVTGTGFGPGAVVSFDGLALPTVYVGPGELTATIPASSLAVAGSFDVVVSNPAPGGGASAAVPFEVRALVRYAARTSAGGEHSCITDNACLGRNASGQLGDGTTLDRTTPLIVTSGRQISAGAAHTCRVDTFTNRARCWGANGSGQLGDGSTIDRLLPVDVGAPLSDLIEVSAGRAHTCALRTGGGVACWGDNTSGQLGLGVIGAPVTLPANTSGISSAVQVAAAGEHTCAILADATVQCWGANTWGQLGTGDNVDRSTPSPVAGLVDVVAIATRAEHTCALLGDTTVRCWGRNDRGQLGTGDTADRNTPAAVVGLTDVSMVAAGGEHTCALLADGTVRCWGANGRSNLGDGTTVDRSSPVVTAGLAGIIEIAAGDEHTIAQDASSVYFAWGANTWGQAGDGSNVDRVVPGQAFFHIWFFIPPSAVSYAFYDVPLSVDGWSFAPNAIIRWEGVDLPTTHLGATHLEATAPVALHPTGGDYTFSVYNPPPFDSEIIIPIQLLNPSPNINSHDFLYAPSGDTEITLRGTYFAEGLTVTDMYGSVLQSTVVSSTEVRILIPANMLQIPGTIDLFFMNPFSGPYSVPIWRPFPVGERQRTISALTPSVVDAASASFTLVVDGESFQPYDIVVLAGTTLATTVVSSTQLTAVVPAALVATGGEREVRVGSYSAASATLTVRNPQPLLTVLDPAAIPAGSPDTLVTIHGAGFVAGAQVTFGGTGVATTFVSTAELLTVVPAALLAAGGTHAVAADNPAPAVAPSVPLIFTVTPAPEPPVATALSPATLPAGSADQTVTVDGENFHPGATVLLGGVEHPATLVDATRLSVIVPAAVLASGGFVPVAVRNPPPNAGVSNTLVLTVENPAPLAAAVTPDVIPAGAPDTAVTIDGLDFVTGAIAEVGGVPLATSVVSATQLTALLPASLLATTGSLSLTVTNPAPAAGPSAPINVDVVHPAPVLVALSPDRVLAGAETFVLTVQGSSFAAGAVVSLHGAPLATTFVSSTELTATVPSAAVAAAGTLVVTAANPVPAFGPGNTLLFSVANPTAVVSALSPSGATAPAEAFLLTVSGSDFLDGAAITFGGQLLATTFVSTAELTAYVSSSLVTSAGDRSVTVTNPAPSDPSAPLTFIVAPGAAVLSAISPANAVAAGRDVPITLHGGNFVPTSVATVDGAPIATTYAGETELTAVIPGALAATARTRHVAVDGSATQLFRVEPARFTTGGYSTCLLRSDDTAACTGYNAYGELGDGTTTNRSSPVDVVGLDAVAQISGGTYYTCARRHDGTVRCWGLNDRGQLGDGTTTDRSTPVSVAGLTDVAEISTGAYHTCARKSDGSVWCWGYNVFGQLGTGDTVDRLTPVQVTDVSGAVQVEARGWAHTCALLDDGTIRCWGFNGYGSLGDGSFVTPALTVQVTGVDDAVSIASGNYHTCAVLEGGGARCWGLNDAGQLGDGTFTNRSVAVQPSGLANVTSMSAGTAYTCAVLGSGGASCWGQNTQGNLGNGSSTGSAVPVAVVGLSTTSILSAGAYHVVAELTDHDLRAWGWNVHGQLGSGNVTSRTAPIASPTEQTNPTPSLFTLTPATVPAASGDTELTLDGASFTVGSFVTLDGVPLATTRESSTRAYAVAPAARLRAPGTRAIVIVNPPLGGGSSVTRILTVAAAAQVSAVTPPVVPAGAPDTAIVVRGSDFDPAAVVLFDGMELATTYISPIELGATIPAAQLASLRSVEVSVANPAPSVPSAPISFDVINAAPVLSSLSPASAIAGGPDVVVSAGGAGFVAGAEVFVAGVAVATSFVSSSELSATIPAAQLASAGELSVAVVNPAPSLGPSEAIGFTVLNPVPVLASISPASTTAGSGQITLTAGGSGFVAGSVVYFDGAALATTFVSAGELVATLPSAAIAVSGAYSVTVVSTGPGGGTSGSLGFVVDPVVVQAPVTIQSSIQTCAIAASGSARCAGFGFYGNLGNGANLSSSTPVTVSGLSGVEEIGSGGNFSCALDGTGAVSCWGYGLFGQLGNGGTANSNVPVATGINTALSLSVASQGYHACVRLSDTSVRCWGQNTYGQIGDGTTSNALAPATVVGLTGVTQVSAGAEHTCAVLDNGTVHCWGRANFAQLGDGGATNRTAPVLVAGLAGATQVAAGGQHTCALLQDASVWCWGRNSNGQIGNGASGANVIAPVLVSGLGTATAVSAGVSATCALLDDGTARCWGNNSNGQLGDGTTTQRNAPVAVTGLAGIAEIRAGGANTTCARTTSGAGYCWGNNGNGQLGDGTTTQRLAPVATGF